MLARYYSLKEVGEHSAASILRPILSRDIKTQCSGRRSHMPMPSVPIYKRQVRYRNKLGAENRVPERHPSNCDVVMVVVCGVGVYSTQSSKPPSTPLLLSLSLSSSSSRSKHQHGRKMTTKLVATSLSPTFNFLLSLDARFLILATHF